MNIWRVSTLNIVKKALRPAITKVCHKQAAGMDNIPCSCIWMSTMQILSCELQESHLWLWSVESREATELLGCSIPKDKISPPGASRKKTSPRLTRSHLQPPHTLWLQLNWGDKTHHWRIFYSCHNYNIQHQDLKLGVVYSALSNS